ncbi:unnamed protein product [Laminaria digitata]
MILFLQVYLFNTRTKLGTATAAVLLLLLCISKHSSSFQGSFFSTSTSGSRRGSRIASAAMDVTQPNTDGLCLAGYWGIVTPQQGVPDKVLQAIREEPWRGLFEPCVDHPLTEIEVEGIVPEALQGTLFRNGESSCLQVRTAVQA